MGTAYVKAQNQESTWVRTGTGRQLVWLETQQGTSWWALLTQHYTFLGDPLHILFCVCTTVALLGATHFLAERKNIGTSDLFFYSVTVLTCLSLHLCF